MARRQGGSLMMAGGLLTFIGLCIVLTRVLKVPEYWILLMVGLGLFLMGLIRWFTHKDS